MRTGSRERRSFGGVAGQSHTAPETVDGSSNNFTEYDRAIEEQDVSDMIIIVTDVIRELKPTKRNGNYEVTDYAEYEFN